MAAVMGETYPDLYSAAGIHSGLAYGSANDVLSAFSAMRGDGGLVSSPRRLANRHRLRTIVFQGSADLTVHPSNADRIVAAATPTGAGCAVRQEPGRCASGRSYTRTIITDPAAGPAVEYWLVEGAGHAWSGGHSAGTYTDPQVRMPLPKRCGSSSMGRIEASRQSSRHHRHGGGGLQFKTLASTVDAALVDDIERRLSVPCVRGHCCSPVCCTSALPFLVGPQSLPSVANRLRGSGRIGRFNPA